MTAKERFLSNINRLSNGCWEYTKGRESNGYSRIMINRKRSGAHRYSWSLVHGPIASETFICHKCDFPSCVNPDHLFAGNQHDNILDCLKKGRLKSAKLKPADIQKIRQRLALGHTLRGIATDFSVHHKTILAVKDGSQWKHL